jgi:superfamily II DNA or RNA helicase
MLTARPYQVAATDAVFDRLIARNEQSTLLTLATGLGKTVVFSFVAQKWSRDHPGRILVLAHREELISQAAAELNGILGTSPAIEMASQYAIAGGTLTGDLPPVVVASVQTLCQPNRLARWPRDEFGLIVCDEAHHSTAASYRRIYDYFSNAKRLGVTATPKRSDQLALGSVFGSVCYEMGICEAVEDGWLVPVEQRYVTVKGMDLSEVRTEGGDFAQGQLGAVLTGDTVLDQMVAATVELCGDEPTLIFTAPRAPGEVVSQGDLYADALNKIKPGRAVFLSGETERDIRRRELEQFEHGHRQYLVGCSLFTEGFNVPKISRVVMARPTKSVVYYTQAIGRGTRTLRDVLTALLGTAEQRKAAIEASLKPSVLVIDFVGNSGRHKLVSAVDIFAGKLDPKVVARAKKKSEVDAANGLQPKAVQELLAEAEREEAEEQRKKLEAEERRRERKARVKVNSVSLHQESVNPFETSDAPGQRGKKSKGGRATTLQIEWIRQHGGYCHDNITAENAGRIISDIRDRWTKSLCSPKQERVLKRAGLCDGPIQKDHAKALLDWMTSRQWSPAPRPSRSQVKIVIGSSPQIPRGFQLQIDGAKVGNVFESVEKVRQVYAGLCVEQAAAVA